MVNQLNLEQISELVEKHFIESEAGELNLPEIRISFSSIAKTLISSDILLYNTIRAYQFEHGIIGSPDQLPIPPGYPPGSEEFGPILYWLTNTDPPEDWSHVLKFIWYGLREAIIILVGQSKIDPALYDDLISYVEVTGIGSGDGTIWGLNKYQQLNRNWITAALHYVYYKLFPDKIALFATIDPVTKKPFAPVVYPLQANTCGNVRIAVIGDWGTGLYDPEERPDEQTGSVNGPAFDVMQAIEDLSPGVDYVVHLGDVYYAGTGNGALVDPGEERRNLIDMWTVKAKGAFTLNSNHEMYSGANGLIPVDLAPGGPFSVQNQRTFFALTFGEWVILGLDSAYYCDDDNLYMNGRLIDPEQLAFVRENGVPAKKVMVMTHHNGLAFDASKQLQLWEDLTSKDALGRAPDYWYWGHVHDGIAYSAKAPTDDAVARCVGHGAIPYTTATGLLKGGKIIDEVDYFAHTPVDPSGKTTIRVHNGFAIIELTDQAVSEAFYELDGTGGAVQKWPPVG